MTVKIPFCSCIALHEMMLMKQSPENLVPELMCQICDILMCKIF